MRMAAGGAMMVAALSLAAPALSAGPGPDGGDPMAPLPAARIAARAGEVLAPRAASLGVSDNGIAAAGPASPPLASEWSEVSAPDRGDQVFGIPSGVFWRQVFPGMLLLLATAAGVSFGYVQLRREVTRRRAIEVRLQAARDLADSAALAKSTFFATMSHEIRTPLSGIIGMLDLLKRGSMGAEQRQMLLAVDTSAKSLLQILDQVMDFSKAEANRMSLESIPVDLRAMIQSVVMVMGEPARRRGVRTTYEIDDTVSQEILGDPLRIRQILTNLISNAAKFTAHGEVRLTLTAERTEAAHQSLRFVVSDTGIGIAPEKLAQLMEPFRQADTSTTRRYGGSGLGLSVSSRLAALMGGRLTLSSVPGHGTRAAFACRFPVYRRHAASAEAIEARPGLAADMAAMATGRESLNPQAKEEPRPTTRPESAPAANRDPQAPPRALVVDDHAINRDLMRRQLASLGYACDVRSDGSAALEALHAGRYAVLLTDCQMPAMDGAQLARAWREEERRRGVAADARMPIVVVTAKTEPARLGGLDIDACMRKPITLERLRTVLLAHLPRSALTPALLESGQGSRDADGRPGLGLATLRSQFGGNETALRQFLETSVAALRADLAEVRGTLCPRFCGDFANWLHRALGALGMLGQWPVLDEGNALEEALRRVPGPDLLPEVLPFLQRFTDTVNDLERQIQRL